MIGTYSPPLNALERVDDGSGLFRHIKLLAVRTREWTDKRLITEFLTADPLHGWDIHWADARDIRIIGDEPS